MSGAVGAGMSRAVEDTVNSVVDDAGSGAVSAVVLSGAG